MDFKELTPDQKEHLKSILIELSHRERQCFLAHHVNLWSYQRIADELGVSKGTVNRYMLRAKEKIKQLT